MDQYKSSPALKRYPVLADVRSARRGGDPMNSIPKIVSGGQTGADRAALDWALAHGVGCGGWCPKRRKAGDGPIDPKYSLKETPSASYAQRTEWNVRGTNATVLYSILTTL